MNMGCSLLTERSQSANCCMTAFRIIETQGFLPAETAHLKGFGNPLLRDQSQLAVKRRAARRLDGHGTEADHRVVAGDRTIGFDIDHDVGHVGSAFSRCQQTNVLAPAAHRRVAS
jgi:hypothetical protein